MVDELNLHGNFFRLAWKKEVGDVRALVTPGLKWNNYNTIHVKLWNDLLSKKLIK